METVEWRVEFDAEVMFSNGGSLRVEGFRLDIPGEDISDAALGELFVRHLGLLMVGTVVIGGKRLIREFHKGSRGVDAIGPVAREVVELGHAIRDDMITYPGIPGQVSDYLSRIMLVANTGVGIDAVADLEGIVVRLTGADGPAIERAALLAEGIPIVEHLCGLNQLPPNGFRFHAAPLAVAGMGTFPVRAYAVVGG